jgi:predicted amidophosphoribosyltransferase
VETCIDCVRETVPPRPPIRCRICKQALSERGELCRNRLCLVPPRARGFGHVAAISVHTAPLTRALREYKYDGVRSWRLVFGRLLLGWLEDHPGWAGRNDLILPNPSYRRREPYRHVESILQAAVDEDEIPVDRPGPRAGQLWPIHPRGLLKIRPTPRSAGGSYAAKREAARAHADAVRLRLGMREQMVGARVLLVDDVFTTGAQLDAVGRKLQQSWGVARVDALVIARHPWT